MFHTGAYQDTCAVWNRQDPEARRVNRLLLNVHNVLS